MKTTIYILALISFSILSFNANAQWQQTNGPYGGYITCLLVDGANTFAGTAGSGIFLSSNNGTTWSPANNGLTYLDVRSLVVSGSNIFAGTGGGGIFLSTDHGNSWAAVNSGLWYLNIRDLAISGSNIFAATFLGVFLSTNNGGSWVLVNNGITNTSLNCLAVDGSNIYVGGQGGVYLSTNNGGNWAEVNTGLTSTLVRTLAVNGANIFAGTANAGVFFSNNSGSSWTAVNNGLGNLLILSLSTIGTNIFAGTYYGVYTTSNNGNTWTLMNNGLNNYRVHSFANRGTDIFVGTEGEGVFFSNTNGNLWTGINTELNAATVYCLATSGSNIFAGTSKNVFLSSNNGNSWTEMNNGLTNPVRSIAIDGSNIFAGTDNTGMLLSTNNGNSWNTINNGLTNLSISSIAVSGSNLYAGTLGGGIFLSTNSGNSWNAINNGLTNLSVFSLAVNGINIFAGTSGGVFLSTNNGISWIAVNNGLTNLNVLCMAVNGSNIFAGMSSGGMFMSTDNGTSWSAINIGPANLSVNCIAINGSNIFIGTSGGVFLSTNNGNSWSAINNGLTLYNVSSLIVNGTNIFAGTFGGGVFIRPLSEMITLPLIYPKITLNASLVSVGSNVIISGSNFSQTGQVSVTIHGPAGFSDIINTTSNVSGSFTLNYPTTSTMPIGNYTIQAKDMISGFTTVVKSFTLNNVNPINYLSITNPLASFSIDVNDGIILEFKDKMILDSSYPVSGANRLYSYYIEISSDGGVNWQPVTTLTGQFLINQWVSKQHSIAIATAGSNYKLRITDTYNPTHFVSTPLFVVNSVTVTGNLKVQLLWDYSYPQNGSQVNGICADGTARIYLDLSKINSSLGVPISSVSVVLDDGGLNTGYAKLGKVKVATNTSSYSSEANGITTITAINNTAGLADYYFWYVAPDDFVGNNVADESGSERFVQAIFTVTFADASVEVITKKIKIVRPPLMLVHGIGGDPSTWDNFRENLFGNTYNYSNNYKFKTVVPVRIDPASNFANNAFGITGDGTNNSMPGIISQMRLNGYASVKVDYIGHSMGGSVLRYALDHYYNRFTRTGSSSRLQYKNYEAGYVNKVITLGTPHNGSPIADIINRYVGDIPLWARFTLHNWYGLSEKPFPFYYIKPVNPNAFIWDYEPTAAVMDLRTSGGVRFYSSNVKAHLIAGDIFPGTQINLPAGLIPQGIIDQVHDVGDNTLEHFINYLFQAARINETDPTLKQAIQDVVTNYGPVSDALSFLENLSLAMDAVNYTTFIPESDLIVSVNSQLAGYSQSLNNVSKFDSFIGHSWPFPVRETNNLQIGNQVMHLLNEPINSSKFDVFPDNSSIQRRIQQQLQPLGSNPYYSIRDTTILKLVSPVDSSSCFVDSTMIVGIELIDTVGLKTLNVYFQGKTYPINNFRPGYFSINLQVNSNEINWRKLVVEGYYHFTDSAKLVYDEHTFEVITSDTLIGFSAIPELVQLAINQISFADFIAQYIHFSTPLDNFDQSVVLTVNDTNIVSIDASTHGFRGKNHGQTFAIASYHGFSDTIYFDVTGCIGGTVGISSIATSICQGDTLQLAADNGTEFEWSTGDTTQTISVTTSGEYSLLIIDGNGCIASTAVIIEVNPIPSINISGTNANCFGASSGMAAATVTSGTLPYTYSWSPSGGTSATASNLASGNYTLTVLDSAGCSANANINITQPATLTAAIGALTNVHCYGGNDGSATAHPTGGTAPYTYLWSSGATIQTATNLSATNYVCNVTDTNGCIASLNLAIGEPQQLILSETIIHATCSTCCDGEATVIPSGGTAGYTYLWLTNGNTSQSVTSLCPDTFMVVVTDANSCTVSDSLVISYGVDIEEMISAKKFLVYPNPSRGLFTVKLNSGCNENGLLKVFNSIGTIVFNEELEVGQNSKFEIDLSNRAKGIYLIQLMSNKTSHSQLLVIE